MTWPALYNRYPVPYPDSIAHHRFLPEFVACVVFLTFGASRIPNRPQAYELVCRRSSHMPRLRTV